MLPATQHQPAAPCRCVVLHHLTPAGNHFDLMIQRTPSATTTQSSTQPASKLATWQAPIHPRHWAHTNPLRLTPLPDHRPDFLTYQGPLTRKRGTVQRADSGYALWLLAAPTRFVIHLQLRHFQGTLAAHYPSPNLALTSITTVTTKPQPLSERTQPDATQYTALFPYRSAPVPPPVTSSPSRRDTPLMHDRSECYR